MTEKELQLVQQLLEKTRAKAIHWDPTARANEFVAAFKGQVTFTISRDDESLGLGAAFRLVMRDPENREILMLEGNGEGLTASNPRLAELYRVAHDSALKVEETLDAILDDLRAAS